MKNKFSILSLIMTIPVFAGALNPLAALAVNRIEESPAAIVTVGSTELKAYGTFRSPSGFIQSIPMNGSISKNVIRITPKESTNVPIDGILELGISGPAEEDVARIQIRNNFFSGNTASGNIGGGIFDTGYTRISENILLTVSAELRTSANFWYTVESSISYDPVSDNFSVNMYGGPGLEGTSLEFASNVFPTENGTLTFDPPKPTQFRLVPQTTIRYSLPKSEELFFIQVASLDNSGLASSVSGLAERLESGLNLVMNEDGSVVIEPDDFQYGEDFQKVHSLAVGAYEQITSRLNNLTRRDPSYRNLEVAIGELFTFQSDSSPIIAGGGPTETGDAISSSSILNTALNNIDEAGDPNDPSTQTFSGPGSSGDLFNIPTPPPTQGSVTITDSATGTSITCPLNQSCPPKTLVIKKCKFCDGVLVEPRECVEVRRITININ